MFYGVVLICQIINFIQQYVCIYVIGLGFFPLIVTSPLEKIEMTSVQCDNKHVNYYYFGYSKFFYLCIQIFFFYLVILTEQLTTMEHSGNWWNIGMNNNQAYI